MSVQQQRKETTGHDSQKSLTTAAEEDSVPLYLQSYLESHKLEETVNSIVNKVLKERPEDPIEEIANLLQQVAPPSYPSFDKMSARRVFLQDNPAIQSVKVHVYLQYQGQQRLAHTHIFSYDEEEKNHFLFNQPETKTGLQQTCALISNDFSKLIQKNLGNEPLNVENLMRVDSILLNYFRTTLSKGTQAAGVKVEDGLGLNLVRVCSEAISTAVGKTLTESESQLASVFRSQLNPSPDFKQNQGLKYLIPLYQGGKLAGSPVRFSKFYLIVEPGLCSPETLNQALKLFQTTLRKSMASVKGGEAAFKVDADGPCFNAFSSINETFKQIEDALNVATPVIQQQKPTTSDSQKTSDVIKPIRIGVSCDADFLFNKDPKDPNKYDVEGAKGLQTSAQLQDYYLKMIQDHPLLTYLEDGFAEADTEGARTFRRTLARKFPQVQLGVFFKSMEQMQNVTMWEALNQDELVLYNQKVEAAQTIDQKDGVTLQDVPQVVGQKNANKFTPHVAQIRTGAFTSWSDLCALFKYISSQPVDQQFGVVLDDRTYEDISTASNDTRLIMAQGYSATYYCLKGNLTRALLKIKNHLLVE